jgi:hypothetical protein
VSSSSNLSVLPLVFENYGTLESRYWIKETAAGSSTLRPAFLGWNSKVAISEDVVPLLSGGEELADMYVR